MVNQAIRNNPDKFPSGYVIELTNNEKEHVVKNFDHLETLKFSHATVKGFTEQGLYMLATILKSPMATATAIAIIDTFTQLRKLAEIGDLRKLSREELELYDEDIKNMRDIYATRKFDEKKGMEIGMEKEKLATARRLLSMGLSEAQVATATELPLEEIQKMKE